MTNNLDITNSTLKICAGLGCRRVAVTLLTIKYLNTDGYFCNECSSDLIAAGLAINLVHHAKGEGSS